MCKKLKKNNNMFRKSATETANKYFIDQYLFGIVAAFCSCYNYSSISKESRHICAFNKNLIQKSIHGAIIFLFCENKVTFYQCCGYGCPYDPESFIMTSGSM